MSARTDDNRPRVLALVLPARRRRSGAAAQAQRALTEALAENLSGGAVFMLDRDLRFVSAEGPILAEMLQRSDIHDLVGKTVQEVVAPANRAAVVDAYSRTLRGERLRLELSRDRHHFETRTVPIYARARTHARRPDAVHREARGP